MDFREMAIQAHHDYQAEQKELGAKWAKRFAQDAAKAFAEIAPRADVSVKPVNRNLALIMADGIEMVEARKEHMTPEFYTKVVCPRCKEKSYVRTPTLADIGEALENGPKRCDRCEAKRMTIQPGGWPEQMADAFREAIYEMQS